MKTTDKQDKSAAGETKFTVIVPDIRIGITGSPTAGLFHVSLNLAEINSTQFDEAIKVAAARQIFEHRQNVNYVAIVSQMPAVIVLAGHVNEFNRAEASFRGL